MFGQNHPQGPILPQKGGLFDELKKYGYWVVGILGTISFIILVIHLLKIIIPEIGDSVTDIIDHISNLFRDARRLRSQMVMGVRL